MSTQSLELVSAANLQEEVDARENAIANVISKIDKNLLTDIDFEANPNGVNASVDIINPATNTPSVYNKPFPIASTLVAGIMSKESFTQIQQNTADIATLLNQQGGKYIGEAFNSKAALDVYVVPETVNPNDFTFVAPDETHENASAMYIYNGATFTFARIIEEIPVPPATESSLGLVLSSTDNGKILVENNGTMSLNGYDNLVVSDSNLSNRIDTKVTANAPVVGKTGTKVTYDEKGLVTGSGNLVESDIPNLAQSKITGLPTALSAKADQSTVDSLTAVTNTKIAANAPITPGTASKVTYDDKGLITGNEALVENDLPSISQSKVTGLPSALNAKADKTTVDNLTSVVNGKVTANGPITAGAASKVTYDAKGLITGSSNLLESDIPALSQSKITGLPAVLLAKADQSAVDTLSTNTNNGISNLQTQVNGKAPLVEFNELKTDTANQFALKNHYAKEMFEYDAGNIDYNYAGIGYIESVVLEIDGRDGVNASIDVSITVDDDATTSYNQTFVIPAGISRFALANNHGTFITGIGGLYILKDMSPLVVDSKVIEFTYPTIHIDFASSINVNIKPSAGSNVMMGGYSIHLTKITRS